MRSSSLVIAALLLVALLPLNGHAARDVREPELQVAALVSQDAAETDPRAAALAKRAQHVAAAAEQHHRLDADEDQEEDDDEDEELQADDEEESDDEFGFSSGLNALNRTSDEADDEFCYNTIYRKKTLKVIKEIPFVGLFHRLPQRNVRYEASGVCIAKGFAWVVFDSFRTIAKLDLHFNYFGDANVMVPDLDENPEELSESQFEGLAYKKSTDTFLAVRETFQPTETSKILSRTEEIRFNKDLSGFRTINECTINFEFEDINKGFEGIYYFEKEGKPYLMGLCESNYCKTVVGPNPPGLQPGNGRLVIAELNQTKTGCEWNVLKVLNVPASAHFLDYSVITFRKYMHRRVAIASQEDAAVWIGTFDWAALEFTGKGKVFHFPRNDHCQKIYCNVEGMQFLDAQRVVLTSDKSKATQPHHCMHKDQSLAVMALPKY